MKKNSGFKKKATVRINVITVKKSQHIPINSIRERLPRFSTGQNPDVILDSGAQSTCFSKLHPVMVEKRANRAINLEFADGNTSTVDGIGNMGELRNINISGMLTHECLSISQLAKLGYATVFDQEKACIFKRETILDVKRDDILIEAFMENGLYKIPMNDLAAILTSESSG